MDTGKNCRLPAKIAAIPARITDIAMASGQDGIHANIQAGTMPETAFPGSIA